MRIGKWLLRSLPALALIGVGVFCFTPGAPAFSNVKKAYRPSDAWIVDRNGHPLESIRTAHEKRSLDWISWESVSPSFQDLLIQVEDQRFYYHWGVDPLAIGQAVLDRITGQSYRGASTLTMQLAGLLDRQRKPARRDFREKGMQILAALKLETTWTKAEILEAYINTVAFRGELIGLHAASMGYFGKNPSGLTSEESAFLIALLRSPNSKPDLVAKRTCAILKKENCDSVAARIQFLLSKPYQLGRSRDKVPIISHHFIEGDMNASVVRTTLDGDVQELAMRNLREQLRLLKLQNVNDGAVLVLETATGKVVAYAANAGTGFASANQVDGIQSRRQAGSTIKPFVYATAFDWKLLRPNSLLEDSPTDVSLSLGRVYHPKNYDQVFRGLVSVGNALGSSMNVPAVRALRLVGEARVLEKLKALGFEDLQGDDYYGPSLALGSIDATLWELTQGYRQFAVGGAVFSDQTREEIFNILAAPEYRRFTFGMESILTLPFPAAVKTGTSKDMRDNWCIGWTPHYTVGVWVGNFTGDPMWAVSGISGAAPIWRSLMLALHPDQKVTKQPHYEPPAVPLPERTLTKIRYPAADMLVGWDPDIPRELQKLPIEVENPQKGHRLFLNHRLLSRAQDTTLWSIQKGKYKIELQTASGKVVDTVQFEVR